ncbi:phospholipid:diacylglycerol acyltransferase [Cylindrobasidium torrendii FP15055 ss-10]|uniref:Phospholipid:diacylglycerol acyltransferase n=1 Tax=Cylindrobasidium torrendii FP15055 ss-10 TaxID=1314674 RepID=A0A0D7AYC6_9AGAR|nr:phospholipid:diacylglycerol acyltransferase [Cylindrobasidium torrendii FP15055 ss-10]
MSTVRQRTKSTKEDGNLKRSDTPTKDELKERSAHLRDEVADLKLKAREAAEKSRSFYATRRFLFTLGILFGLAIGFTFIERSDIEHLQGQLMLAMDQYDISIPDFSRVETEYLRLKSNIPEVWKLNNDGREFAVGESIAQRGLSAEYPVVLIPGVISTGLESWSTTPEHRPFFRQRVWGGVNMLSQVLFNRDKWITAMLLDPVTGLDPPGAKVRAAEGIDAASSFIQGYWIWQKIVENLACVNYDTDNLYLASYDWRLSYSNLEVRDGYFSRLKSKIEGFKKRQGKKTVIAAHSMGSSLMLWFFKWVEAPGYGDGGPNWVEDHIEAFVSLAGTFLGVAKSQAAFMSGEMKDTVELNPAGAYVLEQFFSRAERRKLFLSWAGTASMWVKGGDTIWGNGTWAPDDAEGSLYSHGALIAFRESIAAAAQNKDLRNMTTEEAGLWILQHTPATFQYMMDTNFSTGIERDEEKLIANDNDPTTWSNPLESRLPNAPSMKIYCVYGHGKDTERSYWYAQGEYEYDENPVDAANAICHDPTDAGCVTLRTPLDMPLMRKSWIDSDFTNETILPKIRNGVNMGEGDGTVSLLSLGAMCVEGWKRPRWNPGGIQVTTVELPHQPVANIPRGGANTSDHVDILGSHRLNEILLQVATGAGEEIQEQYVSNIREYASRIQWDEEQETPMKAGQNTEP